MTAIGILGGTGLEAKGLALRFAAAGVSVFLGSRSAEKAAAAANAWNALLGKPLLRGLANHDMLKASTIVMLAVPFRQAVDAIEGCRAMLSPHHILVDVTVPMVLRAGHAEYVECDGRSNSEMISAHLPEDVRLVAAFKTIPALILADLAQPLDCDLFVCGDSDEAKQAVMEAASLIPALRPIDVGPLITARTLERMTVLAVEINRRCKKKGARYRVVGI